MEINAATKAMKPMPEGEVSASSKDTDRTMEKKTSSTTRITDPALAWENMSVTTRDTGPVSEMEGASATTGAINTAPKVQKNYRYWGIYPTPEGEDEPPGHCPNIDFFKDHINKYLWPFFCPMTGFRNHISTDFFAFLKGQNEKLSCENNKR